MKLLCKKALIVILFFGASINAFASVLNGFEECSPDLGCKFFDQSYLMEKDFQKAVNLLKKVSSPNIAKWLDSSLTSAIARKKHKDEEVTVYLLCERQNCGDDHYSLVYTKTTNKLAGVRLVSPKSKPIEVGYPDKETKVIALAFDMDYEKKLELKAKKVRDIDRKAQKIIEKITEYCKTKYATYSADVINSCMDSEVKAADFVGKIMLEGGGEYNNIVRSCIAKYEAHGFGLVKVCVEEDVKTLEHAIKAQQRLSNILHTTEKMLEEMDRIDRQAK